MPRIRWKPKLDAADFPRVLALANTSIETIQAAIGHFVPYDAGGAESAKTKVVWAPSALDKEYSTTDQEHSEMVGLHAALITDNTWSVCAGGTVTAAAPITAHNYSTDLPHCAYCTVFLHCLGLPLTTPTKGRYNLAVNLGYPLPPQVSGSLAVLGRLISGNAGGDAAMVILKRMINPFLSNAPGDWVLQLPDGRYVSEAGVVAAAGGALVLTWADASAHSVTVENSGFGENSLLVTLWKFVFQAIYDNAS